VLQRGQKFDVRFFYRDIILEVLQKPEECLETQWRRAIDTVFIVAFPVACQSISEYEPCPNFPRVSQ
jgi:hypothetical protein